MARKINNNHGFSLLEVMIAITLFAFFITAYLTSQGYNVEDSILSEEQLMLQQLAERKINELVLNPPTFSNGNSNQVETKTFEETELANFEYTIELKKLSVPDFGQIFGQKSSDSNSAPENDYYSEGAQGQRNTNLEKVVFSELKKNIEKVIWQARVTIKNKETKYTFTLSTFLTNYNEKIQLNFSF